MNIVILYTTVKESLHRIIEEKIALFPLDFQNEIRNYANWADAQKSVLGRLLLQEGMNRIGRTFNQHEVFYNNFKKPILKSNDVKFNISHSGELVVCALTKHGNIGVDVEKIRYINWEELKSQMTNNEIAIIATSKNKEEAFFNYWTKKEAVLKAHGKGLLVDLPSFEVINNKAEIEACHYFTKEVYLKTGYKSHLAINSNFDGLSIDIHEIDLVKIANC
ncbi:hypothetical protein GCM10011506_36670 [Marivirga lumbricoides]|uniref:4'-phosphopantetheinyl transferase domain-containing protein n=1 Tax=Marivirga lumbricoides TaxID=1046115 RepID=A0ABQ1MVT8_9BACT|nr:hypothetical protein GCM10011506_36670 [Marivirga lumbricoides]